MLLLQNLNINQIDTNSIYVQWEFAPTTEDLSKYTLSIYRSESPGIPDDILGFELVVPDLDVTTAGYLDRGLSGLSTPGRIWYYKIIVKNTDTNNTSLAPRLASYFKGKSPDLYTKEILRQKRIVLEKFVGRKFFLLKRRTWGSHCNLCWDEILFRCTNPDCPVCYGTGWISGYFEPTPFFAMLTPAPQRNQIMMFGEWKPSDTLLETLNYPPLVDKDVIVDDSGNRWVVIQVQKTEKLGFLLEQRVQLARIEYDDVVYSIPINYDTPLTQFKYY